MSVAYGQASLFSASETPLPPPVDRHLGVDFKSLENLAFLYTATETGAHSGIRFMMTIDEAMVWCESPVSCGVLHGTRWAYFFTRVSTFVRHYLDGQEPVLDLSGEIDNGAWDARIASLGLKKIGHADFANWLSPHGLSVIGVAGVN